MELQEPVTVPDEDGISHAVRSALRKLPHSARELIILRYYDNLSYEQISSVLGLSLATINGRLHRAKKLLAKVIKEEGVLE